MTGHLMNPVNRQYFEGANLCGLRNLIGIHGCLAGCGRVFFKESQPGFIRHPIISNYCGCQSV